MANQVQPQVQPQVILDIPAMFEQAKNAIFENNFQAFNLLFENDLAGPQLVDMADQRGKTLLHIASTYGRSDFVQRLLNFNQDINRQDIAGDTALHKLRELDLPEEVNGYIQTLNLLLGTGADKNIQNDEDETPLQVIQGTLEMYQEDLEEAQNEVPQNPGYIEELQAKVNGFQQMVNILEAEPQPAQQPAVGGRRRYRKAKKTRKAKKSKKTRKGKNRKSRKSRR